jgi:hypothetical protein
MGDTDRNLAWLAHNAHAYYSGLGNERRNRDEFMAGYEAGLRRGERQSEESPDAR